MKGWEMVWCSPIGSGAVVVGVLDQRRIDEAMTRYLPHGLQHARIPDAARLELAHHHLVALPFEGHGVRSPCGHEPTSVRSASNDA